MNANGVGVARALQWLIGIAFITIGLLHTDVHFRELSVEPYALALGNIQGFGVDGTGRRMSGSSGRVLV